MDRRADTDYDFGGGWSRILTGWALCVHATKSEGDRQSTRFATSLLAQPLLGKPTRVYLAWKVIDQERVDSRARISVWME